MLFSSELHVQTFPILRDLFGTSSSRKPSLLPLDSTGLVLSLGSEPQSVTPLIPSQGFWRTQQVLKQCFSEGITGQ